MTAQPTTPATIPARTPAELAEQLEAILADLAQAHESLLDLVREHRRAVSSSDTPAIQECLTRQGVIGVRIADLERSRCEIVTQLAGKARAVIAEVLPCVPEDFRARIEAAAQRLRTVLSVIQRENGIIRSATQTLLAHIDGLMQQVARALSHAGTYGRQGRVEGTGPIPCGIDMLH